MAKVKIYRSCSFIENGVKHGYLAQIYESVGIYIIFDNNPRLQSSTDAKKLNAYHNRLVKSEKKGEISNLTFGGEIEVEI